MTELVCCLSSGKGTWTYIKDLIKKEIWDNIFLITNNFGVENFQADNVQFIVTDFNKSINEMMIDIQTQLKGKIKGIEVALNLISGSGKEHMGILSALLKQGVAIRLVDLTQTGIKEI